MGGDREMKKKFLSSSIGIIASNKNYSDEQLEIIAYGLEGLYLTITKLIIIFGLAVMLDIFLEVIILLIAYNIIRSQAFGLHASKSIHCLIISTTLFVGGAYVCKYMFLPFWMMMILCFICNICLFIYAPADTVKRPLINERKRKRFKFMSLFLGIFYTIFIIVLRDYSIVNYLVVGLIEAVIMILPISYKILDLPYDNYKRYESGV